MFTRQKGKVTPFGEEREANVGGGRESGGKGRDSKEGQRDSEGEEGKKRRARVGESAKGQRRGGVAMERDGCGAD